MMEPEGLERLQYLKETGQVEEAKLYEQYLRETGQMRESIVPPKMGAAPSDASRVAPRPDGGGDLQAILSGGQGRAIMNDVVPALGAHAINAAQSIPFMRNVQAGALAATSPMNYDEAKTSLDDLTSEIPGDLRVAEQIATGALPWTKGAGIVAPLAGRAARATGAFAKELPGVKSIMRGTDKAKRAWNASKPATKATEKAKSLDDILGNMEIVPEAPAAQTLEEVLANPNVVRSTRARTASGALQKGAPKARFDWFAEQAARRQQAAPVADAAEPSLEDLLSLSLEHVKKGGSMKSASDALKLVRQK